MSTTATQTAIEVEQVAQPVAEGAAQLQPRVHHAQLRGDGHELDHAALVQHRRRLDHVCASII